MRRFTLRERSTVFEMVRMPLPARGRPRPPAGHARGADGDHPGLGMAGVHVLVTAVDDAVAGDEHVPGVARFQPPRDLGERTIPAMLLCSIEIIFDHPVGGLDEDARARWLRMVFDITMKPLPLRVGLSTASAAESGKGQSRTIFQ